jgi:hypothetical protein
MNQDKDDMTIYGKIDIKKLKEINYDISTVLIMHSALHLVKNGGPLRMSGLVFEEEGEILKINYNGNKFRGLNEEINQSTDTRCRLIFDQIPENALPMYSCSLTQEPYVYSESKHILEKLIKGEPKYTVPLFPTTGQLLLDITTIINSLEKNGLEGYPLNSLVCIISVRKNIDGSVATGFSVFLEEIQIPTFTEDLEAKIPIMQLECHRWELIGRALELLEKGYGFLDVNCLKFKVEDRILKIAYKPEKIRFKKYKKDYRN